MKNTTKLACTFLHDTGRDFYMALHSDLNRIFRYDENRILAVGIERAEYELNHLLTYLIVRIIHFSDGYVLVRSGWRNRCAAGEEIARTLFNLYPDYFMNGGGGTKQPSKEFEAALAERLRCWVLGRLWNLSNATAFANEEEVHTDYFDLLKDAEVAYMKVWNSNKDISKYFEELRCEIESWDDASEPSDLNIEDIPRCQLIANIPIDMINKDPYARWVLETNLIDNTIKELITTSAEPEIMAYNLSGKAFAPISPTDNQQEAPVWLDRTADEPEMKLDEQLFEANRQSMPIPEPAPEELSAEKELLVFGMKWKGTKADIYDFLAWASNESLIDEEPLAIARHLKQHGGFETVKEDTLRTKISTRKSGLKDQKFSKHSYAKRVRHNGRASEEDENA